MSPLAHRGEGSCTSSWHLPPPRGRPNGDSAKSRGACPRAFLLKIPANFRGFWGSLLDFPPKRQKSKPGSHSAPLPDWQPASWYLGTPPLLFGETAPVKLPT